MEQQPVLKKAYTTFASRPEYPILEKSKLGPGNDERNNTGEWKIAELAKG